MIQFAQGVNLADRVETGIRASEIYPTDWIKIERNPAHSRLKRDGFNPVAKVSGSFRDLLHLFGNNLADYDGVTEGISGQRVVCETLDMSGSYNPGKENGVVIIYKKTLQA